MGFSAVFLGFIVFSVINYLSFKDIINYYSLMKYGIETSGKIVETRFYYKRSVTVVRYTVKDNQFEEKSTEFMFNTLYENGKCVIIKYDRVNPSKFLIIGDTNIIGVIIISVSNLLVFCGLIYYFR